MGEYKNSIQLGIQLPKQQDIQGQLDSLLKKINNTKINLDVNIANSDVAKQLEILTNLANNFKTSLGGNISLGNINKIVNQATISMERLNSEILKTKTVLNQDGTGNRYSDVANGIGVVTKQMEVLNQETKQWEQSQQSQTIIVNNEKIRKTLDDITIAQEKLNSLQSRGNVNTNEVDRLRGLLGSASENIQGKNDVYNSKDINEYLNQVKTLENEEKKILKNQAEGVSLYEQYEKEKTQIAQQEQSKRQQLEFKVNNTWQKLLYEQEQKNASDNEKFANQVQNAWDKTYQERIQAEQKAISEIQANEKKAYEQEILRLGEQAIAEQKALEKENELNAKLSNAEFLNNQKSAYKNLFDLQNEEYSLKEKLISAEGQYKQQLSERLVTVNQLKSTQQQNIQDNNLSNLQKEVELDNQRVRLNEQLKISQAKNNDKVNSGNASKLQQEQELLQKQAEAYHHINALKANGIVNESDIVKLEEMVKNSKTLQDVRNSLNAIMNTSMMKESSIVSLSKQLDNAQIKLDKMKQTFGNKLPNGFIQSMESEINRLKEDLTKVDSMSFNSIKNSLNQIDTQMKVTNNETQQLVNSLKQTNNSGFFSGMTSFLGKIGVFYGAQQVVQEISQQFKNASDYTRTLDANITNIQMITGKTKSEVVEITNQFKELGAQLHITNQEMLAGSEELLRAGYDNDTTSKMLEASSMASKISGQTTQSTTEQLIAIKNAFNMTGDQMQHVIDVISKLDNTSATSFAEVSSAIMRTAFSAQQAGTSFDTLSTYVTTVSEKTRRSAETIGEAFKSIYSRLNREIVCLCSNA